jgi:drug/metabolite transporter (DMT)-like permease
MPQRRHRWLTIPSGLLLFACLALPGYRDCGTSKAMTSNPLLVATCLFGLAAAVCAAAVVRRKGERWVAIAVAVVAVVAVSLLVLACAAFDRVYAGITLGLAAAVGVAGGGAIWEREARGRPEAAAAYFRLLVPVVAVGVIATAALSTWKPVPDQVINVPSLHH